MNLPPSQLDVLNPASACSPLAAEAGSPTGTTHSIKRSSEGRWQLGGGAETETEAVWSVCICKACNWGHSCWTGRMTQLCTKQASSISFYYICCLFKENKRNVDSSTEIHGAATFSLNKKIKQHWTHWPPLAFYFSLDTAGSLVEDIGEMILQLRRQVESLFSIKYGKPTCTTSLEGFWRHCEQYEIQRQQSVSQ